MNGKTTLTRLVILTTAVLTIIAAVLTAKPKKGGGNPAVKFDAWFRTFIDGGQDDAIRDDTRGPYLDNEFVSGTGNFRVTTVTGKGKHGTQRLFEIHLRRDDMCELFTGTTGCTPTSDPYLANGDPVFHTSDGLGVYEEDLFTLNRGDGLWCDPSPDPVPAPRDMVYGQCTRTLLSINFGTENGASLLLRCGGVTDDHVDASETDFMETRCISGTPSTCTEWINEPTTDALGQERLICRLFERLQFETVPIADFNIDFAMRAVRQVD